MIIIIIITVPGKVAAARLEETWPIERKRERKVATRAFKVVELSSLSWFSPFS